MESRSERIQRLIIENSSYGKPPTHGEDRRYPMPASVHGNRKQRRAPDSEIRKSRKK